MNAVFSLLRRQVKPCTRFSHHNHSLHTTPNLRGLGIVEHLRDEESIVLPGPSSPERRNFWEVIEFKKDGRALETWKTPEVMHLHPRDVHLFTATSGYGVRAAIAPRATAILFRTEAAKCIINADRAVLFPVERRQDTIRVAQAIKTAISQHSALPFELRVLEALLAETARVFDTKAKRLAMLTETAVGSVSQGMPASSAELHRFIPISRKVTETQFDVKETLEAITDVTNDDEQLFALCLTERVKALAGQNNKHVGFDGHGKHGQVSGHEPPATLTADQRKQLSMRLDRVETPYHASGSTGNGNGDGSKSKSSLSSTNGATAGYFGQTSPTPSQSPTAAAQQQPLSVPVPARSFEMRVAARILESYEYRLLAVQGALEEQLESLETTRHVWNMSLDHHRNRILRVNLLISMISLGGLLCTLPAAFLGMNVDIPGIFYFWPVVQGSLALGMTGAGIMWGYYRFGPKRRYKARLRDMRSLRDLLTFHFEDLDAILEAAKARGTLGLSKKEFAAAVQEAIRGRPMSSEEVDLLFRVFDTNKDAVLQLSELMRLEELQNKLNGDPLEHHIS